MSQLKYPPPPPPHPRCSGHLFLFTVIKRDAQEIRVHARMNIYIPPRRINSTRREGGKKKEK